MYALVVEVASFYKRLQSSLKAEARRRIFQEFILRQYRRKSAFVCALCLFMAELRAQEFKLKSAFPVTCENVYRNWASLFSRSPFSTFYCFSHPSVRKFSKKAGKYCSNLFFFFFFPNVMLEHHHLWRSDPFLPFPTWH